VFNTGLTQHLHKQIQFQDIPQLAQLLVALLQVSSFILKVEKSSTKVQNSKFHQIRATKDCLEVL
jgi:hypothetical protein